MVINLGQHWVRIQGARMMYDGQIKFGTIVTQASNRRMQQDSCHAAICLGSGGRRRDASAVCAG